VATASVNPGGPIVSPFVDLQVTGVEVRQLATKPVQVEAVIRGNLPDQCAYRFHAVENRQERSVRIQIKAIHPANGNCAQTAQAVEYIFPLGRDMPEAQRGFAPGEYELVVNDYRTTFSIKD
jgi:hypothetical protein